MSAEIDRRIREGWMSFNRYREELHDRPTASLALKTRMVKSEVVEALQYGCAAWTPLKGDYQKLRAAHHRKEEERAAEVRRDKREAEKADKTHTAPGVTAGQLRRFRAALIGPAPAPDPIAP